MGPLLESYWGVFYGTVRPQSSRAGSSLHAWFCRRGHLLCRAKAVVVVAAPQKARLLHDSALHFS